MRRRITIGTTGWSDDKRSLLLEGLRVAGVVYEVRGQEIRFDQRFEEAATRVLRDVSGERPEISSNAPTRSLAEAERQRTARRRQVVAWMRVLAVPLLLGAIVVVVLIYKDANDNFDCSDGEQDHLALNVAFSSNFGLEEPAEAHVEAYEEGVTKCGWPPLEDDDGEAPEDQ